MNKHSEEECTFSSLDLHNIYRPIIANEIYYAIVRVCIYCSLHRHHTWSLDSEIYSSTLSTNNSTFGYHLSNILLYYIDIQGYARESTQDGLVFSPSIKAENNMNGAFVGNNKNAESKW